MVESGKRKERYHQEGKRPMKAEYEQRCKELAQEVLLEMRSWREEHPTATLREIEEEVDQRMARMRAGLVEGIAMTSAAVEGGSRAAQPPAPWPRCGGVLQAGGKQVRQLRTTGGRTVRVSRSYGY